MGGDFGPQPILDAAVLLTDHHPDIELTLVGQQDTLAAFQTRRHHSHFHYHYSSDIVTMADKPSRVLRTKRDSSMWRALELVMNGDVQACVSCGNTGALMVLSRHLLKTFPGIDRPAICKPLPSLLGQCYLLDLGANINCPAEQLLQFAMLGSVLATATDGNKNPSVGLLNVGQENIKGIEQVREAAQLLTDFTSINYVGFVEGDDIFTGNVDVVVCDGFVGNIALKVSEGAAKFLAANVKQMFVDNWYGRLVGLMASPIVNRWRNQYDPVRYNGACFLGLQGTAIKSHGGSDARGCYHALLMAADHVRNRIPEKIKYHFSELNAASQHGVQ